MDEKIKKFAEDLEAFNQQIHVLNGYLQTLADRQRQINQLRSQVDFLQSILDEQRRHF